ncbi:ATP-binding protein [Bacillus sp. NTK074B]|uniref:ATP-binding protein n=1 Tax=Bacillus sp. NTK074B TaxID=2802174 RepID=UPI001A8CB93A|nr:ATP-binding protein [Bacillus sp. NTK074B]
MEKILEMKFDLNTIDHLGVKLYSSFPPVIAELVSNSYDADARKVKVIINNDNKEVQVIDDGNGMSFEEINNNFLIIGRNRRIDENNDLSPRFRRPVTGKKGLGKLAVFGIAEEIEITSIKDCIKNKFIMNYNDIKESQSDNGSYRPRIITFNEETTEPPGTQFIIRNITKNNITDIETLAESLSGKFNFFDDNFVTTLTRIEDSTDEDENSEDELTNQTITVTNELYHNRLNKEFSWEFPEDFRELIENNIRLKFLNDMGVTGHIFTNKTPLPKKHTGFILYARRKLVQDKSFFDERSNDRFHSYVSGYFHVDFVDNDNLQDFVSTDRRSLLWDQNENLSILKDGLDELVRKINYKWRENRKIEQETKINEVIGDGFYNEVSPADKLILQRFQKQLTSNVEYDESAVEKVAELMTSLKKQLHFEYFKNYVSKIADDEITLEEIEEISQDWEQIEIYEMSKIAMGRIETINRFEHFINNNASETKEIQPFLERFPWILDPRMTKFDREVTFSRILKAKFPDQELEERNRRIDFICSHVNGTVHIIELKRPNIKLSSKEINQAIDYQNFSTKTRTEITDIKTFLVSDNIEMNSTDEIIYNALNLQGKLTIRTYTDMLQEARHYHKQFLDAIEQISAAKEE